MTLLTCRHCGSYNLRKRGRTPKGGQVVECKDCGRKQWEYGRAIRPGLFYLPDVPADKEDDPSEQDLPAPPSDGGSF